MAKVIVPKNHVLNHSSAYSSTISTAKVTINANIAPEFIYDSGEIIVNKSINYTPTSGIISITSNVSYRINLFDSISEDDKEVRFIKLTLKSFPAYIDNRNGTNLVSLLGNINIYKKSSSTSADCTIPLSWNSAGSLSVNGTYWLTFDTSTKKYSVAYPVSDEPLLISKAIVPKKDNWMNLSNIIDYSPSIGTEMTISTGDGCNQPYIGRTIRINNETSSNVTISSNTIYALTINTDDKILCIFDISLGKFIGRSYTSGLTKPSNTLLLFQIYINNNSTPVHSINVSIPPYISGNVPIPNYISSETLYIDVKNNKTITSAELSKAIDAF